jgi:hypothetical protein
MRSYLSALLVAACLLGGPAAAQEMAVSGQIPESIGAVGETAPAEIGTGTQALTGRPPVQPKKSLRKAFFLSLVLPGAGEYYAGARTQAKSFLGAEAAIWSFAGYSKFQGEMWRRDYRNYAAQRAGANPGIGDDLYYQNIYEYPTSDIYNEEVWAEARLMYPGDPQAQEAYVSGKLYTGQDDWAWQTASEWYQYRGLRVKSQESLHRISYSYAAALLNRLLSSVNAARLARQHNRSRNRRAGILDQWQLRLASGEKGEPGIILGREF